MSDFKLWVYFCLIAAPASLIWGVLVYLLNLPPIVGVFLGFLTGAYVMSYLMDKQVD